jgi:hypothetical protein
MEESKPPHMSILKCQTPARVARLLLSLRTPAADVRSKDVAWIIRGYLGGIACESPF